MELWLLYIHINSYLSVYKGLENDEKNSVGLIMFSASLKSSEDTRLYRDLDPSSSIGKCIVQFFVP